MKKIYLPGLNGIRAIAALMVVIGHFAPFFALQIEIDFSFSKSKVYSPGSLAVTLFFVLSGFLITYLLILEKREFNKIDLKAFYWRRVLRIWPLYYTIIALSIVIIYFLYGQNLLDKKNGNFESFFLYLFFGGNFAEALYHVSFNHIFSTIAVLWSVGVEEQFYLFWPLLVKFFKKSIYVFFGFLMVYAIIKIIIRVFFAETFLSPLINLTRLDCMAIGAIGSCLVLDPKLYKQIISRFVFNKYVQLTSWAVLIIGFILLPMPFSIFSDDVYAIFFIIIIINVSHNENTIVSLEFPILNFLGRISYGIYMYHGLIMFVLRKIIPKPADTMFNYFFYMFLTIMLTIAVAYFSNNYLESYFLKKKSLLAKIKSKN